MTDNPHMMIEARLSALEERTQALTSAYPLDLRERLDVLEQGIPRDAELELARLRGALEGTEALVAKLKADLAELGEKCSGRFAAQSEAIRRNVESVEQLKVHSRRTP